MVSRMRIQEMTSSFIFLKLSLFCFFFFFFFSSLPLVLAAATDTLNTTLVFKHGDSLVSSGGSFALGFFNPGGGGAASSSSSTYLGIWYNSLPDKNQTIVWVANRESPINGTSASLQLSNEGILTLRSNSGSLVWSSNSSSSSGSDPVCQLLDTGNLVIRDGGSSGIVLWQSFDFPGNTLLPHVKLGWDFRTGLERFLSNWKSDDDPSRGEFSYRFDPRGYPEVVVMENSVVRYRLGPWNGLSFSGKPQLKNTPYNFEVVVNEKEAYYSFYLVNSSIPSRLVMERSGMVQRYMWVDGTGWKLYISIQNDNCDRYALCGAYGSCSVSSFPICSCLAGFVPRIQGDWDRLNWSSGCVRNVTLNCSTDGFRKYEGVKLPETAKSWYNSSLSVEECRDLCTKNCSCMAYSSLDIRDGGSGCLLWFGELIDMRKSDSGQDIFIRMPASELVHDGNGKNKAGLDTKRQIVIIVVCAIVATAGILSLIGLYHRRNKQQRHVEEERILEESLHGTHHMEDAEVPHFNFGTISYATDNFSFNNMIGEGGFGRVYKGVLKEGQQVAVKRLSQESKQGIDEFKNEVKVIAKLQHRNLVKLLGYCAQTEERMLIYEYMPNKSLEYYIFDEMPSKSLEWPMRFLIINGIARGLLYLHQDSRLRIVHRDLKLSNILLDNDMNPKISDFGMARIFLGNDTEANTKRVVGTYGYMSPEYAIDGIFSTKSDVFSFGVMVLEIITGRRNRGFNHPNHQLNLLGHAWRLFQDGRYLELIDPSVMESCNLSEVLRSVQVGLLCVQHTPEDRPSMSNVVLMLGGEGSLPRPNEPGFFTSRKVAADTETASSKNTSSSINDVTITTMEVR